MRRIDIDGRLQMLRFLSCEDLDKCCRVSRKWMGNIEHYWPWHIKTRRPRHGFYMRRLYSGQYDEEGFACTNQSFGRRWEQIDRYKECCSELKAKAEALSGQRVFLNADANALVEVRICKSWTNMTLLSIRNQMTKHTASALGHLLHHLKGFAFDAAGVYLQINPAILELFRGSPLDIRSARLYAGFPAAPLETVKLITKKFVKPVLLDIHFYAQDARQLLEFITNGKECCSSLEVYYPAWETIIDECIEHLCSVKTGINLPSVMIRTDGDLAWPTRCPLPQGEGGGALRYEFANKHTQQGFAVTFRPHAMHTFDLGMIS